MKHTILLSIPVVMAGFAFVSCDNPADETPDAKVGEVEEALEGSGTKFVFEKSSTIGFTGSKVTGSHDGGFKDFEGHFFLGEDGIPTAGEFVIQTESLWSDDEMLTGHLKNKDFFEVGKYPTSTFTLTKATKTGGDAYEISGNLELHGVTKNITFPVTASDEGNTASFKAAFDINRKDFEINYAGMADNLIKDEVVIRLDFTAKAAAE